ncbi:putative reverse transcriptase domain-containing protein [Tanacetum coccineum]
MDMINDQDIEHTISPTPPPDYPLMIYLSGRGETPVARKCSYKEFMSCQPFNFKGMEGAVGLICWFERTELVFLRSNCTKDCKVKFATGTLTEEALSWWNSFDQPIGIEEAYKTTWSEFKKLLIKKFQEMAVLCPTMVPNSEKLKEVFIGGLPRSIEGNVTASKPQTLEEAITIRNAPCITQDLAMLSVKLATRRKGQYNKSVPSEKTTVPMESIHAKGQECSPRPERSHGMRYRHCEFHVMLFGLTNAPAVFMDLMNRISIVKFLGHVIDSQGIHVDPAKIEVVKDRASPTTPIEVCQFLGLVAYYRRFIEGFWKIAKPLTELTQKNKKYIWGENQESAFQLLKQKLCEAPILALPEGNDDFVVYCDASHQGLGAVLMQREKFNAYASRQLKPHEENYTTHNLDRSSSVRS